jgi:hypothetical protein
MRRVFMTTEQIEELRETGSVQAGMYVLINVDEQEEDVYG